MIPFFKKDFLIYWRDRKEILIVCIAPIVLIVVLSFALPNWVESSTEALEMKVAFVTEDNEQAGLQRFKESLDSLPLPPVQASMLAGQAEQLQPVMLLKEVLESEEVGAFMELIELNAAAAQQQLEDKELTAIITIPDGYTQAVLNKMLLNEGSGSTMQLTAKEASLKVDVLQSIIEGFMETINYQLALNDAAASSGAAYLIQDSPIPSLGGRETVTGFRMITSFQYYTISISILFALFISQTTASKAVTEKREHVLHRILLTGSHPLRYLSGKIGSTFCMSLLQMIFVFVICHFTLGLFPDRTLQFWLGMALFLIAFCFSTAALSAFFTSISFRMKEAEAGGLMTVIIVLIGTIGGSFVPVYVLPNWIRQLGEYTPNGLSLSIFTQWVQQEDFSVISMPLAGLILFSIIMIMAGVILFPRRGRI